MEVRQQIRRGRDSLAWQTAQEFLASAVWFRNEGSRIKTPWLVRRMRFQMRSAAMNWRYFMGQWKEEER